MSDAVAGVGRGLAVAGAVADKAYTDSQSKAKREGQALTVAEASLASEDAWASQTLEFKKLKGTQASAARAQAFEAMAKVRQQTAEGIKDSDARREYLTRSAERLSQYHRQLDSHTLSEFDSAREETLKARMGQAIGAAEAGDVKGTHTLQSQVEADIRATHPDAADALVERFRQDINLKKFEVTLRGGNVESAAAFLETDAAKKSLGIHMQEASDMLKKAQVAYEKSVAKQEAEGLAGAILKSSMKPDGYLDHGAAEAAIDGTPLESRAYVRTIVKEQIAADAKRWKADFDGLKNQARVALNHGKRFEDIPAPLIAKLETYAGGGEYVDRLREDAETDARRARIRAKGSGADKKALAKEQSRADKLAKLRFQSMATTEQAAAELDDFLVGQGVSETGRLEIEVLQRKAKEHVDSGMASTQDAFTRQAIVEAGKAGVMPHGKKKGMSQEKQAEFSSEAQAAFSQFVSEKKRAPTMAERKEILDGLLSDVVKRRDFWFDTTEKGFEASARARQTSPVAPTRKIKSWVWSPDRKQRRPRYEDNSLGPIETVP